MRMTYNMRRDNCEAVRAGLCKLQGEFIVHIHLTLIIISIIELNVICTMEG